MIKRRLTREEALQKLRHYCRFQERCSSEVSHKLFELGIHKQEHRSMLDQLTEENYFNDRRFANAFASGKFQVKQWGRKKIIFGLREKRIDEGLIQEAISKIDHGAYMTVLEKVATERYADMEGEQAMVRWKKTFDFMVQKGFEPDLVRTFIAEIVK